MATTDEPTTTDETAQSLFRKAADLIDRALEKLDGTTVECKCCKERKFTNFAHAKARRSLAEVPQRLRDQAGHLDVKEQTAQPTDTTTRR